ncbi:sigma 54-interacting transcriptional regulator [Bacillus infantis]|uniref:sigma-54 interaction domain-containing protein n=1 Tax=Bacillus infantis TaxID=324767 RepID=UPI001CD4AFB3|nr:sigma 54-interacting transcriptional regulator [Bacillus infantis]MCA1041388.1 sigma 54-interacting transcriptional regulator [Bacillus infantis]
MMNEQHHLTAIILEQILEHADAGIHAIDHEGRTIIYNRKMAEIEGMDPEFVVGRSLLEVFPFSRREDSTLLLALQSGKGTKPAKQTYFNSKGKEITALNHAIPILAEGKTLGAIEIAKDVSRIERLIKENISRKNSARYTFESIIGRSKAILEVVEAAKRAVRTTSPILIAGETGTGKELFAQSLHSGSLRSPGPFVAQNCAALPETLVESILFGTKKGAFTGAVDRPGLFEQAEGGTLLLDEINSMPAALQARLLRVLQEKKVRRIGDTKDRETDVRIIATINEDPIDAIAGGRLRKDLYYRLSAVSLFIPPLRERKEDILLLSSFFIQKYNDWFGMEIRGLDEETEEQFLRYDWPGNIRELEHVIEGAMNMAEEDARITTEILPHHFRHRADGSHSFQGRMPEEAAGSLPSLADYVASAEKGYINKVWREHNGNITQTAKILGMSRQNLQYRIKKHDLTYPGSNA